MPFTISHAVLAPPLARLSKGKLPIAALAVGCMTPDLIRFFVENDNNASHQWSAIIEPNLFIGLFFTALWYFFYRPMLYDFFVLNDPIELPTWPKKLFFIMMTVVAIIIGVATHLLWDGFTHADARTLIFYEQLSKNISLFGHIISVHMLLQLVSSAIPLPIIAYMTHQYVKQYRVTRLSLKIPAIFLLCAVVCIFAFVQVWCGIDALSWQRLKIDPYHTVGDGLVDFFKGALLGLTAVSVGYMLLKQLRLILR
ncbi:DUF4184 family protein [Acinetobacter boissieri]|uniref:Zinc dependent phospholipase C n=1 Tax=Acinetobacter boissieri TaxID=1219383 RepID=A0A1G6HIB1_9GAMM|nr:DUF4184 family protein [Acinetobacter boissieri]SDB93999.1 protein of unknown function [Acinetobacter boissieri]